MLSRRGALFLIALVVMLAIMAGCAAPPEQVQSCRTYQVSCGGPDLEMIGKYEVPRSCKWECL